MDAIQKFLKKLDAKLRVRFIETITSIAEGKLDTLDIKPLQGQKGWYRCRIGDIRIIFVRNPKRMHTIIDVGFRGSIYKKK